MGTASYSAILARARARALALALAISAIGRRSAFRLDLR